jgi:hypothetical protein
MLCLTQEDSGMLMSSVVVNVHKCGWEGGKKGAVRLGKGTKNGAVDSKRGACKCGSSLLRRKPSFQLRGYLFSIDKHNTCNSYHVHACRVAWLKKNIFSPLQVKNKPREKNRNMLYS